MLGRNWELAQARIVDRRIVTGPSVFGSATDIGHTTYEYIADVQPEDGSAPFRATFKERFYAKELHEPEAGESVRVRFRPKNHDVELDRGPLRAAQEAAKERRRDQFEQTANAAPAAAPLDQRSAFQRSREIMAAIQEAKASGDRDEVERLKDEMRRLQAQHPAP